MRWPWCHHRPLGEGGRRPAVGWLPWPLTPTRRPIAPATANTPKAEAAPAAKTEQVAAAPAAKPMAGDAKAGEKVFHKCKICHDATSAKNKVGPGLQGVLGRTVGTHDGFRYSKAMKSAGEKGMTWTDEALLAFVEKPRAYVKEKMGGSTKMSFPGLKKEKDRDDLITYLIQETGGLPQE